MLPSLAVSPESRQLSSSLVCLDCFHSDWRMQLEPGPTGYVEWLQAGKINKAWPRYTVNPLTLLFAQLHSASLLIPQCPAAS